MIKIALSIIGLAAAIFFHYDIMRIGIDLHLSFTLSRILPYMIQFLGVCMLIYHTYVKYLKGLSYLGSRIIVLLILVISCGTAFYFHPIYQGDFSDTYREITLRGEGADTFQQGLTMVALPGCPFCHARFQEMRRISEIYPNLPMHILVSNHDTTEVNAYRKASKEHNITIGFFPDSFMLKSIINHGFPNLYYKAKSSSITIRNWTNDGFGSAAWDYVLDEEGH